ncbi:MAG: hypothetical protein IPM55_15400 [Acidobacteria bacterium]|nr:hypothetical protein [Acidobacteriota bacterium]
MANELATLFEEGRDYARAAEFYRLAAQAAVRVFMPIRKPFCLRVKG